MKLLDTKCPRCGGNMSIDETTKKAVCEFCRYETVVDDEVLHIQHDNVMQNGYEFEKGRIQARKEAEEDAIREEKRKEEERRKRIQEESKAEIERRRRAYERKKEIENRKAFGIIALILLPFCFPASIALVLFFFGIPKSFDRKKKFITMGISSFIYLLFLTFAMIGASTESEKLEKENLKMTVEETAKPTQKESVKGNTQTEKKSPIIKTDWISKYKKSGKKLNYVKAKKLWKHKAKYYGKYVVTTIKIEENESDVLKCEFAGEENYSYDIVADFENEKEIDGIKKGDKVTIIGKLRNDKNDIIKMKSANIKNTHIVAIGKDTEKYTKKLK